MLCDHLESELQCMKICQKCLIGISNAPKNTLNSIWIFAPNGICWFYATFLARKIRFFRLPHFACHVETFWAIFHHSELCFPTGIDVVNATESVTYDAFVSLYASNWLIFKQQSRVSEASSRLFIALKLCVKKLQTFTFHILELRPFFLGRARKSPWEMKFFAILNSNEEGFSRVAEAHHVLP